MRITCLDLEGVLVPEIWINVAEKTGIDELKLTTRDIPDYDELMMKRMKIIKEHQLTLKDIQEVIATLEPMEGAVNFLDWLRENSQVVILSDTFEEFAKPLMRKLKMPALFCHSLVIDSHFQIVNYKLRIPDAKKKAVKAFKELNFETIAAGDSFNDVSMLKEADHGFFFCPPENISSQYPQFPVSKNYVELQEKIANCFK
ncbi:MAG: bifunctional phosphoserine phosphatase/homoserine phosphotransferase ThrH [Deltaproteobacteria bacterium]|nr:bifunctional phosphoserine phosphatase/homoserine phosphotransferase ThrH [Deltaproteobacteria bacterium]